MARWDWPAVDDGSTLDDFIRIVNVKLRELSRYLSGPWVTPTYAAGNFTGNGAMTWTVDAADVLTLAYTLIGKTMTVAFYLNATSIGGTPNTSLSLAIPLGAKAVRRALNPVLLIDNAVRTTGYAEVAVNGTTIFISRTDLANFTASANNTGVYGQITFEVQ